MGIKRRAKQATAAGVALATGGLSGCGESVVVDPPPPPLACNTVDQGQSLVAAAERVDRAVTLRVRQSPNAPGQSYARWKSADVTDPVAVSVVNVVIGPEGVFEDLLITLLLDSDTTRTASFTLRGVLSGYDGGECQVTRTFTITVDGQSVIVARLEVPSHGLPLPSREPAQIVVTEQEGREVRLLAHTHYDGPRRTRWAVTGGTISSEVDDRVSWLLPADPGLYQVRLVVDYGAGGLAVDNVVVEVT